jgi:hypothetical protein
MKIAAAMAAGAATLALMVAPVAHANPAIPDPSDYFRHLRKDGFLVDGNESYLLGLARIVCDMENAGYVWMDISDYIARREQLTGHQANLLTLDASIQYCTQTHPRLVP